jgi:hypothetical protein
MLRGAEMAEWSKACGSGWISCHCGTVASSGIFGVSGKFHRISFFVPLTLLELSQMFDALRETSTTFAAVTAERYINGAYLAIRSSINQFGNTFLCDLTTQSNPIH